MGPHESFGSTPLEERAHRLRDQTSRGDPGSPETGGLVAHLDGVHVGWCAVEPRGNDESLLRDQDGCWAAGGLAQMRWEPGPRHDLPAVVVARGTKFDDPSQPRWPASPVHRAAALTQLRSQARRVEITVNWGGAHL